MTLGRLQITGHAVHDRGLTCTGASDDGDQLARTDVDIHRIRSGKSIFAGTSGDEYVFRIDGNTGIKAGEEEKIGGEDDLVIGDHDHVFFIQAASALHSLIIYYDAVLTGVVIEEESLIGADDPRVKSRYTDMREVDLAVWITSDADLINSLKGHHVPSLLLLIR